VPEDRRIQLPEGFRLGSTLGQVAMGRHDPCARFVEGAFWWATSTPDGAGTLRLAREGTTLNATGYGPGASWVVEQADAIAGLRDDLTGFAEAAARHPVVAQVAHAHQGVRLPATGRIFPRLLRNIFEQKVTGKEAYRGYAKTVRRFGEPAPGPVDRLWTPPDPAVLAATPYWMFHPFGVEQRRADTLRRAAAEAARLERCADAAEATRRLTAIRGIGPWTAAEVVRVVYGDADAVSVGDYHIPNTVAWALAGEVRGTDERMLELLEPFRGHRGRVCVLLEMAGIGAPRFGPRMPIRSFAHY
jgi:3-methyladenine DNA glycosylase/8-oxoguanine DNA glycosylase